MFTSWPSTRRQGPARLRFPFSGSRTRVLSFLLFFRVVRRRLCGLGFRCQGLSLLALVSASPLLFVFPTSFARRRVVRGLVSLSESSPRRRLFDLLFLVKRRRCCVSSCRFPFSSRSPPQARRPSHCLFFPGTLAAAVTALRRAKICSAWRAVPPVL
jgi:hypothetical protein